ncbi:transglycosylase SLT domain-containing protein [Paracoccaceae bacterium]|nr:transglycosylase SLT domain-containing protein [Paracoccaceae bacterium]
MNIKIKVLLVTVFLFWMATIASLSASVTTVCDDSIDSVAHATLVPKKVLYKIARLESGRSFKGEYVSWPWSLNNAGKGYFLDTKTAALNKLGNLIALGEKNVDVGCMQLNLRWHARHFDSLEDMISPIENVSYAAKFLQELYKETGTWEKAVKFYHSRNSKYNNLYYAKYQKMPVPNSSQSSEIISAPRAENWALELASQTDVTNNSLFWLVPKGSLIDLGVNKDGTPAFTDLRNFKVPPLFKM